MKIRLHALPGAPPLAQKVFKCNASNRFESVVVFLRKRLGLRVDEGVVCYVNSVFAPGLDEGVGGLWKVRLLLVLMGCLMLIWGNWFSALSRGLVKMRFLLLLIRWLQRLDERGEGGVRIMFILFYTLY